MLADYVMKGIDSLFADKLNNRQVNAISANPNRQEIKPAFNRDTIKKSLHTIIKKGEGSKSPNAKITKQPSPISKSRLKIILEHNKDERLKSVVKKCEKGKRETSPYRRIEEGQGHRGKQEGEELLNKENNIIKYYREIRKSTEKCNLQRSGLQDGKKSRIFGNNCILSRNISNGDFKIERF